MKSFTQQLPKIELHAHLNGSISQHTIEKLIEKKKKRDRTWDGDKTFIGDEESKNYFDIFAMFKLVHLLSDDDDAIYMITCDVIKEFAEDNVKYLEIRTTPRDNTVSGMTKFSYIEAVLRGIEDSKLAEPGIVVKLILCVDRKNTIEESYETLQLAIKYREISPGTIVGLDLCGFPHAGDARSFIPVFKEAKKNGLNLTLHLAEAENQNEETKTILEELQPSRLGHGLYIHPDVGGSVELISLLEKSKIPLELCLTSNVKSKAVSSYDNHHFIYWYQRGHPCLICTDDKGVFSTSLSQEYLLAAETFDLTKEQVWDLSYNSIDHIFAESEIKDALRAEWKALKESLL